MLTIHSALSDLAAISHVELLSLKCGKRDRGTSSQFYLIFN